VVKGNGYSFSLAFWSFYGMGVWWVLLKVNLGRLVGIWRRMNCLIIGFDGF